ncbi:MAG: tRNA pseudouridine(55) synthase TruB [Lachnospiraceae bacterium]|nr:tRNA pseudouridine(55) synthase TruB [Lachnospiraceae bacterium]
MINGVINVYKEKGYTSHDVVAKLRGIFKQKKIGHTGTLDPQAEGVLPVCLGNGTKLCDMLTDKRKEYVAEFLFGITTDTQDMTGSVVSEKKVSVTPEEAREAILGFLGGYEQVPPMYSACKVNGKRLYELAREGKEVKRSARPVTIYELEILSMELPEATIRVVCSKGTYIRTLCHDIGQRLGCGAAMKTLLRTRVDRFALSDAKKLSEIEEIVRAGEEGRIVLPVDEMFAGLPAVTVKEAFSGAVQNGNPLFLRQIIGKSGWTDGEQVRVYDCEGRFYGIYAFFVMKGCFKPVKMFLER